MKQALQYALKVALTTLLLSLPLTFGVMMAYMKLLPLILDNYSFNVNLDLTDLCAFVVLLFIIILLAAKRTEKLFESTYNKKRIILLSEVLSIICFCIYLLLAGELNDLSVDEFIVTYGTSFLIALISMRSFPLRAENMATA